MHSRTPPGLGPPPQDDASRPMLVPFPAAMFVGALVTDLAYWRTADPLWSTLSSWLLLIGLVIACVALAAEFVRRRPNLGPRRRAGAHPIADSAAIVLAIVNFIFHVRDGYSAVVPAGPLLSAATVLVLLSTAFIGRRSLRHPVLTAVAASKES
jgi:uncharacterized membrane protein